MQHKGKHPKGPEHDGESQSLLGSNVLLTLVKRFELGYLLGREGHTGADLSS